MQSKSQIKQGFGTFCQMIVYSNGTNAGVGPDYIRLRHRYECTNGQHEIDDEQILMRGMSYCMQIGNIKQISDLNREKGWNLEIPMWYNKTLVEQCTAEKWNITTNEVR